MYKATLVFVACLAYFVSNGSAQYPEILLHCERQHEHPGCEYRQVTCENLKKPLNQTGFCRQSCYCDDGYARDETGACILVKDCPKDAKPTPDFIDSPLSFRIHHGQLHIHLI